ncbi:MAG: MFS transporter [Gammaproteobacteria bacterium]|nr:MFS transporter [Gammaproteobacteria bacterium]
MTSTNLSSKTPGYQFALVAILSINFGIVFFDRNALNFLMPFVQPELGLNNKQVGFLAAALSFTWALAAFGIGMLSDRSGSRKGLLVIATACFSLCSFLSGIAATFSMLLGARLLMGVAEGGVMPLSHSLIAAQVSSERRGLAMGVAQNFGSNLLGSFVAPVALVVFASAFGWRHAFFLAGVPGIISAIIMWFMIDDSTPDKGSANAGEKLSFGEALAERNVLICALLGVLLVGYLVICWAFMPLYLTQIRGVDSATMGWLMGTLGISATIGSFAISGLSDVLGRKPVMIAMPLIGIILPLGALYFHGPDWMLYVIFFVGWGVNGIFPLFMGTVPSESVGQAHLATVLGICMGAPEVLGGVFGPSIAGILADNYSLAAPLWLMLGLTLVAAVLATGLRETAPRIVGAANSAPA